MTSAPRVAGTRVALTGDVHVELPAGRAAVERLRGAQARTMLAYLVLHRRDPVSAEQLAETIWSDEQPATWRPALRGVVTRVRRFLTDVDEDVRITSDSGSYRLELPEPVTVDIETARRDLSRAEMAFERDQHATAIAAAALAQSVGARRFMPGAAGVWADSVEAELRSIHLRSLQVVGQVHLQRDEPIRAARVAREAISVAPLHEPSHRLLMRGLAAGGQMAEAAMAYDRCRAALAASLGVGPSPETVALVGAVLRQTQ